MPDWALATARYGQLPSVKVVRVPRRSQLGRKPIAASAVSSTSALERAPSTGASARPMATPAASTSCGPTPRAIKASPSQPASSR